MSYEAICQYEHEGWFNQKEAGPTNAYRHTWHTTEQNLIRWVQGEFKKEKDAKDWFRHVVRREYQLQSTMPKLLPANPHEVLVLAPDAIVKCQGKYVLSAAVNSFDGENSTIYDPLTILDCTQEDGDTDSLCESFSIFSTDTTCSPCTSESSFE